MKTIHIDAVSSLVMLFLALVTLWTYWPVRSFDFVDYDDRTYVCGNQNVSTGLTFENVTWAFTHSRSANWHPLTWISLMIDCDLYGLDAGGHHVTNLLLHIANSLLLFLVLKGMTGALWRSALVAALFALHPMHVESVAWVTERKDVLSTFFMLLTLRAYSIYVRRPSLGPYLRVMIWFSLGLMAKPMLVTVPFLLLVLDFWPLARLRLPAERAVANRGETARDAWPLVFEKIPLVVLSLLSCVVTYLVQSHANVVAGYPVDIRAGNAIQSYVEYIGAMVLPVRLAVFYPYPEVLLRWRVAAALAILVVSSGAVIRWTGRCPWLTTGWSWYLGTLVPVIGFVQVGAQARADRYTYVPFIGLFIVVAWGAKMLTARLRCRRPLRVVLSLAVVAALAITARGQVGHWKNSFTLFRHALAVTPTNYLAHNNLGSAFFSQEEYDSAMYHFRECIRENPRYARAYYSMGLVYARKGGFDSARIYFSHAIGLSPEFPEAHNSLGLLLEKDHLDSAAIAQYKEAIRCDPLSWDAYHNLGVLMCSKGSPHEAIGPLTHAVTLNPDSWEACNNLGYALARDSRLTDAILCYSHAILLAPDSAKAYLGRGCAYASLGKLGSAVADLSASLRLRPDAMETHYYLCQVYEKLGRTDSAICHVRKALRLCSRTAGNCGSLQDLLARLCRDSSQCRMSPTVAPRADSIGLATVLRR